MVLPLFFSPRSGFYQPGDILEYREESFIRTFARKSPNKIWLFAHLFVPLHTISKVNPSSGLRGSLERTDKKTVVSTKRPALG
jgi:hypothetical protein